MQVFQKGSPIAIDVSKAILKLSEDGTLKSLEEKWFAPSPECSANVTDSRTDSLNIHSFWGLYLISGATSTFCLLLFLTRSLKKYCRHQEDYVGNLSPVDESVWIKTIRVAKYLYYGEVCIQGEASAAPQAPDINEGSSSRLDYESPTHTDMQNLDVTSQAQNEIEMRLQALY
ncbi:hypothetical protein CRYUN_Cryun32bG0046400 [Craigia yunnanensis]